MARSQLMGTGSRRGAAQQLQLMLQTAAMDSSSFSFQRQDVSHLRSFFTFVLSAKETSFAADVMTPGSGDPFTKLRPVDVRNTTAMQRELFRLYQTDQEALCAMLVCFVKHGKKLKNPQGQEELFPTKTLEHKVRRLTTFIRFGFVQEFPDRQSECSNINLLDKHDAIWGKLYTAIFGKHQGQHSGGVKRKASELDMQQSKRIKGPSCEADVLALIDQRVLALDYPTGLQNWVIEVLRAQGVTNLDELCALRRSSIAHMRDPCTGLSCYSIQIPASPQLISVWQGMALPGAKSPMLMNPALTPYELLHAYFMRLPECAPSLLVVPNDNAFMSTHQWYQSVALSRQVLSQRLDALYGPAEPACRALAGAASSGARSTASAGQGSAGVQVQALHQQHAIASNLALMAGTGAGVGHNILPQMLRDLSPDPCVTSHLGAHASVSAAVLTLQRLLSLARPVVELAGTVGLSAATTQLQLLLLAAEAVDTATCSLTTQLQDMAPQGPGGAGGASCELISVASLLQGGARLLKTRLAAILEAQSISSSPCSYLGEKITSGGDSAKSGSSSEHASSLLPTLVGEIAVLQEMASTLAVPHMPQAMQCQPTTTENGDSGISAVAGMHMDGGVPAGTAAHSALEEPAEALMLLQQGDSPLGGRSPRSPRPMTSNCSDRANGSGRTSPMPVASAGNAAEGPSFGANGGTVSASGPCSRRTSSETTGAAGYQPVANCFSSGDHCMPSYQHEAPQQQQPEASSGLNHAGSSNSALPALARLSSSYSQVERPAGSQSPKHSQQPAVASPLLALAATAGAAKGMQLMHAPPAGRPLDVNQLQFQHHQQHQQLLLCQMQQQAAQFGASATPPCSFSQNALFGGPCTPSPMPLVVHVDYLKTPAGQFQMGQGAAPPPGAMMGHPAFPYGSHMQGAAGFFGSLDANQVLAQQQQHQHQQQQQQQCGLLQLAAGHTMAPHPMMAFRLP